MPAEADSPKGRLNASVGAPAAAWKVVNVPDPLGNIAVGAAEDTNSVCIHIDVVVEGYEGRIVENCDELACLRPSDVLDPEP